MVVRLSPLPRWPAKYIQKCWVDSGENLQTDSEKILEYSIVGYCGAGSGLLVFRCRHFFLGGSVRRVGGN